MKTEELLALAYDQGFAAAAVVDTADIVFDPQFRPYCAENLCGQYGVNYTCPPDCGSPEEMKQKILAHRKALVLQTIWESDYADKPSIKEGKRIHNAASIRLMQLLRSRGVDGFMVGASGCSLCQPCGLGEGRPCRYPDLRWSCMSAYCIFVKKLADRAGLEYDCGPGLIGFFGLYVFD